MPYHDASRFCFLMFFVTLVVSTSPSRSSERLRLFGQGRLPRLFHKSEGAAQAGRFGTYKEDPFTIRYSVFRLRLPIDFNKLT